MFNHYFSLRVAFNGCQKKSTIKVLKVLNKKLLLIFILFTIYITLPHLSFTPIIDNVIHIWDNKIYSTCHEKRPMDVNGRGDISIYSKMQQGWTFKKNTKQ